MIKKNQTYLVQVGSYPISSQERNTFNYLYQPIISSKAFLLYHFLLDELQFLDDTISNNFDFSRIYQFLNFNNLDLVEAIQVLIKYELLSFSHPDSQNKLSKYVFNIKKPLSFLEFYKSKMFRELQNQISSENVESIYFLSRKNNSKEKKFFNQSDERKVNLNFDKNLLVFLNSLKCLKNYKLKIQDLNLIQHFYQNIEMPLDVIKIILEFCIFKINFLSKKYLLKIVATLKHKKIINDFEKIKIFFQNLFQNMPIEEILVQSYNYVPQWLIQNFSSSITQKDKKSTNSVKLMTEKEFNDIF